MAGALDMSSPFNKIFPLSKAFVGSGVIDPRSNIYHLRIAGADVDYALEGRRRNKWDSVIFENKSDRNWSTIIMSYAFFHGKGEGETFWIGNIMTFSSSEYVGQIFLTDGDTGIGPEPSDARTFIIFR